MYQNPKNVKLYILILPKIIPGAAWSIRLYPTGRFLMVLMPNFCKCSRGPSPDSILKTDIFLEQTKNVPCQKS